MAGRWSVHPPSPSRIWPAYWQAVGAAAIRAIAQRPLAFVRCPDGVDGEHFFQKHANRGMPATLHEGACDDAPYLALEGVDGLIATAQMSALELHSWGSSLDDAGHPDRLVFDLDPGDGVDVAANRACRARPERPPGTGWLRKASAAPPAARGCIWWCRWCRPPAGTRRAPGVAAGPRRRSASSPRCMWPACRRRGARGRILIDWLRNGLGSTAIASFSPRARPHATVATPVAWREVTDTLDPQAFTVNTVPARLKTLKADPWDGFGTLAQTLAAQAAPKKRRAHG